MKDILKETASNKVVNTGKQLGISQAKGRLDISYQAKIFTIESFNDPVQ